MASIGQFQDGRTFEALAFRKLGRPYIHHKLCTFPHLTLHRNRDALQPYLVQDSYKERVHRWVSYHPHTRDILALHAAYVGDLHLLECLHQSEYLSSTLLLWDVAASTNQLPVLGFLVQINHTGCSSRSIGWAASQGSLDAIWFIHNHLTDRKFDADAWEFGVQRGDIATAECLIAIGAFHPNRIHLAAQYNHLELLVWLIDRQLEAFNNPVLIDTAAAYGHLEIVKYLVHHGFPRTARAMDQAMRNNHMHVVEFLNVRSHP
ncbi:hypothetical protein DYB36_006528 [Aphanomyces astaci]|uniref:Uncharacterized protein n=1 Tax=Aphanomyces astaci TaxID=112090 RepID=A0A397AVF8_APHAT|nr:hypothetical protein DYB36_006528 [Aphanomyces astaci]